MTITNVETILEDLARRARADVNVSLPGVVLSYNATAQTATIQPTIRQGFLEEDDEDGEEKLWWGRIPAIPNVPVAHWRVGGFAIHAPLQPGDFVTLVVTDRSIDEFMATGSPDCTPQDTRRFDWTDAVALPMPPAPTPIADLDADNMHIGNDVAKLRFTPAGKIAIEAGGQELIALVRTLLGICQTAVTGMGVPAFADPASVLALTNLDLALASMEI
jgi:hypothetical protein